MAFKKGERRKMIHVANPGIWDNGIDDIVVIDRGS